MTLLIQSNPLLFFLCFIWIYSACYAGRKEWEQSMEDAKQCIRLDPTFIKGYYRLATAQLELRNYDAAEATIKQGLSLDANNSQLSKILRTIKQAQKAAAAVAAASSTTTSAASSMSSPLTTIPNGGSRQLDVAVAQELHDLKLQHSKTSREYSSFQASLNQAQREEKMYGLTLQELQNNPPASGNYYRSVGKLFVKSSQPQIFQHLETNVASQQTKQQEVKGKLEYLEKRLKSQQLNMKELTSQ